jgi:hypothetical protein
MHGHPFPQSVAGFVRQIGEADASPTERVRPGDVARGLKISRRFSQGNVKWHDTVRFERSGALHSHAIFAKVEDHAPGDAVKAGERGRVDLLAQTMTPVGSHIVVHAELLLTFARNTAHF